MKLLNSFKKELILATRSFYFYIEIAFALVLLAVLLFAIPEHSQRIETRYLYLDLPQQAADIIRDSLLKEDTDGKIEKVTLDRNIMQNLLRKKPKKFIFWKVKT